LSHGDDCVRGSMVDHECRDEWKTGVCTILWRTRALLETTCLYALSAQADYAERTIEGFDWKPK
jgi:hypothetical protein